MLSTLYTHLKASGADMQATSPEYCSKCAQLNGAHFSRTRIALQYCPVYSYLCFNIGGTCVQIYRPMGQRQYTVPDDIILILSKKRAKTAKTWCYRRIQALTNLQYLDTQCIYIYKLWASLVARKHHSREIRTVLAASYPTK